MVMRVLPVGSLMIIILMVVWMFILATIKCWFVKFLYNLKMMIDNHGGSLCLQCYFVFYLMAAQWWGVNKFFSAILNRLSFICENIHSWKHWLLFVKTFLKTLTLICENIHSWKHWLSFVKTFILENIEFMDFGFHLGFKDLIDSSDNEMDQPSLHSRRVWHENEFSCEF